MTQLLIDTDLLLFKAVAAAEYEGDWGDGVIVLSTNLNQAKEMFASMVDGITDALGSKDCAFIISGTKNFRYDLTSDYKANRKGNRKPLGYYQLLDWLKETQGDRVRWKDVLEADDYLGILATSPSSVERIVVSDDKDLKTIPCTLYRLGELSEIDEEEADFNWFYQALTGDAADGYKGCPGIGPVKAEKILNRPGDHWEKVKATFMSQGESEDFAVLQCRLARILRSSDWDSASQSVRLWTP